jgi:aspartyl protease family protein
MTPDDNASLIYSIVMLVIVISALFSRQIPMGKVFQAALMWCGIFAALFLVISFRGEMKTVWQRVTGEFTGDATQANDGTLRIRKGEGGHFYVDAEVNGKSVRFMVDSGATTTTMSRNIAESAGVKIDDEGFLVMVNTANGVAESRRAVAGLFVVGPIKREDFPVHVSDTLGGDNLIGMNWLSSLKGWSVQGEELVINP